jgi:energy-converting hydrogenase Eha subunit G
LRDLPPACTVRFAPGRAARRNRAASVSFWASALPHLPAGATRFEEYPMLAIIAGILIVLWLLGFLAFHVAGGLIHILLVLAVIAIIIHFVTGRRAV